MVEFTFTSTIVLEVAFSVPSLLLWREDVDVDVDEDDDLTNDDDALELNDTLETIYMTNTAPTKMATHRLLLLPIILKSLRLELFERIREGDTILLLLLR
jgi:hypothetical protein